MPSEPDIAAVAKEIKERSGWAYEGPADTMKNFFDYIGLSLQLADGCLALVAERDRLREALVGFVDGECHCDESVVVPCVQCVARAALSTGEQP